MLAKHKKSKKKKKNLKKRKKRTNLPIKPPTMKANAWNKSSVTPTITNFLVLMFSIIAPAMSEEKKPDRARNKQSCAGDGTTTLHPPPRVGRQAGPPPPLCFCLSTSKEERKKKIRNHMTEQRSALGARQPTPEPEGETGGAPPHCNRGLVMQVTVSLNACDGAPVVWSQPTWLFKGRLQRCHLMFIAQGRQHIVLQSLFLIHSKMRYCI